MERDRLRLFKTPEPSGQQDDGTPTARQAALYCLVLAVLEDCGPQTVISEMAEKITALTSTHSALRRFDATVHRERFNLVAIVRLLCRYGVLAPQGEAGTTRDQEKEYIAGHGNALYNVDHRTAAIMLASRVAPVQAAGPDDWLDACARERGRPPEELVRHAVMRRLVDEPVTYVDDLPGDQRDYFHTHLEELITAVRLGLDAQVEVRAEGAAVIDEELSDLQFPKSSAPSFAALVLADSLCHEAMHTTPHQTFVSRSRLLELADQVASDLLNLIPKIKGQPLDAHRVQDAAVPILVRLGLLDRVPGGVRVRPALARYRAPAGQGMRRGSDDLMLFGPHDFPPTAPSSEDDRDDIF